MGIAGILLLKTLYRRLIALFTHPETLIKTRIRIKKNTTITRSHLKSK